MLVVLGLVLLVVPLATRLRAAGEASQAKAHNTVSEQLPLVPLSLVWARHLLNQPAAGNNENRNVVCSPLGLLASLRALAVGTGGRTRSLLQAVVATEVQGLSAMLPPIPVNSTPWWITKLFVQNGPQIRPDFVAHATALGLGVEQVEINANNALFQDNLSAWLRAMSKGRLERFQLDDDIHSPAQLILLGGYYVSARLDSFTRVEASQQQIFRTSSAAAGELGGVPVDFLAKVGPAGVATFEATGVTGVELELANTQEYVLYCFLPPAKASAADVNYLIGQLELDGLLNGDRYRRMLVSVRLPVWRLEETVNVMPLLGRLGLAETLASEQANFSGLAPAPGLRLTDLRQRIKFELMEVRGYWYNIASLPNYPVRIKMSWAPVL